MPAPAKKTRSKAAQPTPWWDATVDVESLAPDQRLAHELVSRRRDLTPSVERIMNTEHSGETRGRALIAFSDSLENPGDPNRDPRVALENALKAR